MKQDPMEIIPETTQTEKSNLSKLLDKNPDTLKLAELDLVQTLLLSKFLGEIPTNSELAKLLANHYEISQTIQQSLQQSIMLEAFALQCQQITKAMQGAGLAMKNLDNALHGKKILKSDINEIENYQQDCMDFAERAFKNHHGRAQAFNNYKKILKETKVLMALQEQYLPLIPAEAEKIADPKIKAIMLKYHQMQILDLAAAKIITDLVEQDDKVRFLVWFDTNATMSHLINNIPTEDEDTLRRNADPTIFPQYAFEVHKAQALEEASLKQEILEEQLAQDTEEQNDERSVTNCLVS